MEGEVKQGKENTKGHILENILVENQRRPPAYTARPQSLFFLLKILPQIIQFCHPELLLILHCTNCPSAFVIWIMSQLPLGRGSAFSYTQETSEELDAGLKEMGTKPVGPWASLIQQTLITPTNS